MWTIEHLMSELEGFCPEEQPAECEPALAAFRSHGTAQVPTLGAQGHPDASELCGDPRLGALPPAVLTYWFEGATAPAGCDPAATPRSGPPPLPPEAWILPMLRESGIPILAGTDTGIPFRFPGWSLHDELDLLVAAGLSPSEALRAATGAAATSLGLSDEVGTIRPGRVADLLLLDADPLADVANTRRIQAVVLRGELLERADLDSILGALGISEGAR
jgi:hypothetical protein